MQSGGGRNNEPVAEAMREKGRNGAAGEDLRCATVVQDAELEELSDGYYACMQVQSVEDNARLDSRDARFLHAFHDSILHQQI